MKMGTITFFGNDGEPQHLEMEREVIDVAFASPVIDSKWSGKCENDHSVRYSTLRRVIDREWTWFCTDCHEEHDSVEDHFECPTCGVHVEPGEIPANEPQSISGLTTYRLNGEIISQEEAEKLIREWQDRERENKIDDFLGKPNE